MSLRRVVWTPHATRQARARGISVEQVERVLDAPSLVERLRGGRVVLQRRVADASGPFLLRVFVDVDRDPPEIVTVYRTSKLRKYEGES